MRKSRKWWLALTYSPKVEAVRDGRCTQTIRAGWQKQEGDQVAFHGWEGVPRHSRWSWRTEYFPLIEVIDIRVVVAGIIMQDTSRLNLGWIWYPWKDPIVEGIAERDFIFPPTGKELGRILLSMHKIDNLNGSPFQILRWRP